MATASGQRFRNAPRESIQIMGTAAGLIGGGRPVRGRSGTTRVLTCTLQTLSATLSRLLARAASYNSAMVKVEVLAAPALMQARAQAMYPQFLGTVTSRLRTSIHGFGGPRGGGYVIGLRSNVVYAAMHEYGGWTRAHRIRPRLKRALYWAGAEHPFGEVYHPGSHYPARRFMSVPVRMEGYAMFRRIAAGVGFGP